MIIKKFKFENSEYIISRDGIYYLLEQCLCGSSFTRIVFQGTLIPFRRVLKNHFHETV